MEPGRGRSRPPWRDASGAGDLWRLCQAVYMATIPTWLGGVGGAAIPTSGAVGGCGARRPAAGLFYRKSVPAASPNKHRPCLAVARLVSFHTLLCLLPEPQFVYGDISMRLAADVSLSYSEKV